LGTITSWPNSLSKRLIQGECVPVSSAIRLRAKAPKTARNAFALVRTRCSSWIWPDSSSTQYQLLPIAQIQSDGQSLPGNIPALLRRYGANLLHCRSPFYLCFEHVDNLGAYRIPSGDRPSHPIWFRQPSSPCYRIADRWKPTIKPFSAMLLPPLRLLRL
jgi:hypothetical protein